MSICKQTISNRSIPMTERESRIQDYDNNLMRREEIILFFQEMIDDESVWTMEGRFPRLATELIKSGCSFAKGRVC